MPPAEPVTAAPDGPVAVTVVIRTAPGEREAILDVVRRRFGRMRAVEAACLQLTAHTGEHADEVLLYELWTDASAFDEFVSRPDMVEYLAELDARVVSRRAARWSRAVA